MKRTPLLLFSFIIVSCSNTIGIEKEGRYYSESFNCESPEKCFELVDSIGVANDASIASWKSLPISDSLISFHDYSNAGEKATILVLENYDVKEAGEFLIRLGSDDGFRLFVNGEEVDRRIIGRSVKPDSDWIKVKLIKGLNQLLFQVNQGTGGWGLYYEIEKEPDLELLFQEKVYEIYKDLPDISILPDTSQFYHISPDPRFRLDDFHSVSIQFIDSSSQNVLPIKNYKANQLPSSLKLPDDISYPILFSYKVFNRNNEMVYREVIPIFKERTVQNILTKFERTEVETPWRKGLEFLFAEELGTDKEGVFSTRMKAEFLWDIMNEYDLIEYEIGGPRTHLIKGRLGREYRPYQQKEKDLTEHVLALHVDFSDSVKFLHQSYAGKSHSLMTNWTSYADFYGININVPFISEREEEYNTAKYLEYYSEQISDSIHTVAWSKSSITVLNALGDAQYPNLTSVNLISPWFTDDPTSRFVLIKNANKKNKHLSYSVWHGLEDTDVPTYLVQEWINEFRSQSVKVTLHSMKHSNHWNYWKEPEIDIYSQIRIKK